MVDLLGMDDLLGGLTMSAPPAGPSLSLLPAPSLTPADFQAQWGVLPAAPRFTHPLAPAAVLVIEANKHQVRSPGCLFHKKKGGIQTFDSVPLDGSCLFGSLVNGLAWLSVRLPVEALSAPP